MLGYIYCGAYAMMQIWVMMKFKSEGNPSDFAGLEIGANDGHTKWVAFLFHPIFPFVISVQQSLLQATIVNFHFRR
jgi:hypothetical protein